MYIYIGVVSSLSNLRLSSVCYKIIKLNNLGTVDWIRAIDVSMEYEVHAGYDCYVCPSHV